MRLWWTPKEERALRDLLPTCQSIAEVAHRLSKQAGRTFSYSSVHNKLTALGLVGVNSPLGRGLGGAPPPRKADPSPTPEVDIPVTADASDWEDEEPTGRHARTVDTDRAPAPSDEDAEAIAKLVEFVRRKPTTLEAACDAMDLSPGKLRKLADVANDRGFRVEIEGTHIGRRPHEDASASRLDLDVMPIGERHTVALVGDIHYGSKHHLGAYFKDYCRQAYEAGARKFLHVGDLLDGVYKHSVWEQSHRGYEEQVNEAIEELPRMPGATWYFIQGNHDETLGEQSGLDVGRAIEQSFQAAGRTDLVYLGARAAYVRLVAPGEHRGVFVELWHPRDRSSAYAKSYRMQKRIEAYPPGAKPDILGAGHWHQSLYVPVRGVHALSAGCWQGGQSSFGKSLSGSPDIGSWIVQYTLTSGGTVRCLMPQWVGYFEKEAVRDVAMG